MRIVEPEPAATRVPVYCRTCGKLTSEGKPVCKAHIAELPYPRRLMAAVASWEREASGGHIRLGGIAVSDALLALEAGPVHVRRLAVSLGGSYGFARRVLERLERAGLARLEMTKRGWLVARRTQPAEAVA